MKIDNSDLRNFATVAVGALYVWVGIKRQEAPDWAFDAVLVLGILVVASVVYKLFVSRKHDGTGRPKRSWKWASSRPRMAGNPNFGTARPATANGGIPSPPKTVAVASSAAIANNSGSGPGGVNATLRPEPTGVKGTDFGSDTLAEWTSSVAPGSTWM